MKTHNIKWVENITLSSEEKRKFFGLVPEKLVNTLSAYYCIEKKENIFFYVDANITENIIGDMPFDLDDEDECARKERALSILKLNEDYDKMNTSVIKNMKHFRVVIK